MSMSDAEPPIAPPRSQRAYWIFQLTGWGFYTLSRFFGGLTVMHLPWLHFGLELLLVDALGFGLSHLLRDYVRRHQWRALPILKLALRIIAAGIVCGIPLGVLTEFTDVSLLNDPNEFLQGMSWPLQLQLLSSSSGSRFTLLPSRCASIVRRNSNSPSWRARCMWRSCAC
jgi:hypothetical protein